MFLLASTQTEHILSSDVLLASTQTEYILSSDVLLVSTQHTIKWCFVSIHSNRTHTMVLLASTQT